MSEQPIKKNQFFPLPHKVEPRFIEPLYNEVLGITNDIFQPSNSVMYAGKRTLI